jgi:hypothetical protein
MPLGGIDVLVEEIHTPQMVVIVEGEKPIICRRHERHLLPGRTLFAQSQNL